MHVNSVEIQGAARAEWYRYRIVDCLATSLSPVPPKTRRVEQRCTLNLSRAETSSRWCGVVVRRGGASSGVVHVTRPWFKITWSVAKSPRVAEQCDVNIQSINQPSRFKVLTLHVAPNKAWTGLDSALKPMVLGTVSEGTGCETILFPKNLNRHIKTYHSVSSYICAICKRTFNRKDSLRRHQSTTHGCPFVQTTPSTSESSSRIRVHRYSEKENAASTSHATNDEEKTRPIKLSNSTRKEVFNCFECGKVFYQRNSLNQHVKTVHASSTSFLCPVCNKNCVTVHGLIRHLKIHTTNGEENVPSTSTVNNPRQMEQYETYFNTLDFTGINFPTPLKDIAKFEKVNEISINVYGLNEENKVFPLLITKRPRGINAAKVFMEVAIKEAEEIEYLYSYKKSMIPLTKEQQDVYDSSSHCHICSGSFTKEDWKVRDHCHLTDSCRFMPSSLEKLVINLKSDQFRNIKSFISEDKVTLLMRKGCFPYDYVSGPEKLNETCLPPKEKFYNRLNDEYITDNDYQHANHVWNAFNIKTLGEYSDLYVKTDVLILSDIFENFRSVCMKAYNLDPVWYYTAPGLSWDSMLKFTKVKIELLMDYDMYLFIEKGIRGGISQCSNRYARANNKFLPNFEPSKPQNFLLYLDANNLYGWAMSQYLPLNDFKWVDFLDVDNIDENGGKGYILEVDLVYPESLHDDHSDLPLAPQSSVPPDVKKRDY
ncbi:uncharacterized protein TNCV_4743271 [Trichonephila clavipes]|nr:uncharacterized protein TNCV_4743271 [Trichonephila clavipes]